MKKRVAISGMGIISALGDSLGENRTALLNEQSGIGKIQFLDTVHKDEFVLGEVKFSNNNLAKLCNVDSDKYNRTTLLALKAAREALGNFSADSSQRTGFISSSTVGGMCTSELFYTGFFKKENNNNFIDSHYCGVSTRDVANILGIRDFVSTISTACSSAANAVMLGCRMIENNLLDRVLVGGVDSLTRFTLNGFNTLMILDRNWCKPFDADRKGLNLGEGAAYLLLESEASLQKSKKQAIAYVSGYGNANDAHHQTASSPEGKGAFLAMEKAFAMSGLDASQIDYVNAHGTGTPNNDSSEGLALERIFKGKVPPFSSTKAFTGHTLAAAAGIEAVISIIAMQEGKIFPNLNHSTFMPDIHCKPQLKITNAKVSVVLSNSFGFGGNCSSLIFSAA